MSEIWVRLIMVIGTLGAVALVASLLRRPDPVGHAVSGADLGPGVYLFTSGTCADCLIARDQLGDRLGATGFIEVEWEKDPASFARLGIEVVPCTVLVAGDGSVTRYPGLPDGALERFNP
jgi:hypothetical protein